MVNRVTSRIVWYILPDISPELSPAFARMNENSPIWLSASPVRIAVFRERFRKMVVRVPVKHFRRITLTARARMRRGSERKNATSRSIPIEMKKNPAKTSLKGMM